MQKFIEKLKNTPEIRTDISKRLEEKRMYRRNRRNRLWYREPRFNNRKGQILAPSVQQKLESHIRLINKIRKHIRHSNDAFVISDGTNQTRCMLSNIEQKRKNSRCLQINRKGYKPSIRKQRYRIQPRDLVKIDGKYQVTSGVYCNGTRIIVNKKSVNARRIESVFHSKSFVWL